MTAVKTSFAENPASSTPFTPSTSIPESDVQRAIESVQQTANSIASAQFVVAAASSSLSAERVTTDTATITWDHGTAGQAKAVRAAITGPVTVGAGLANSAITDLAVKTAHLDNLAVTTGKISDDAVTFAKIQNIASDRLLGRDTASAGDPEEISVGGGLEFTGSTGIQRSALTGLVTAGAGASNTAITDNAIVTAHIAIDQVTFARMQNLTTDRLIGRDTVGTGDPEEISVGGGIEFTGSAGIQRSTSTKLASQSSRRR